MLIDELKKIGLEGDIADDADTLTRFSRDASLFEIKPQIVIFPKNTSDLEKLVSFVNRYKKIDPNISLTSRSAGTDMSGGAINNSIILDFTKYFKDFKIINNFAITEPGVFYRDFETETLKHNLIFPSFPASKDICAMGGIVNNNSGGEKTLTYGKTEKYVESMSMVLADGNTYEFKVLNPEELQTKLNQTDFEGALYKKIYKLITDNDDLLQVAKPKVNKNSAGYYLWNIWDKEKKTFDLTKLFVGAQGTLGIMSKAKLRLVPVKKHSKLFVIFLPNLKNLAEIINTVLPFKPETFESFDDNTLKIALRYLPEIFKKIKTKNLIKLVFQFLPEMKMVITGGYPHLILMAEFTDNDEGSIDKKMADLQIALKPFKVKTHPTKSEEESQKYWTIRHESFNLLRLHTKGKHTAPFIDDIIVKHEYLPEFLPKLNQILEKYNLVYTIAGHVGDGNFHIIPLMDFKDPKTREIIPQLSQEVYTLVLSYHGSTSAEHNDGLIRSHYLPYMFGQKVYNLFVETKKIFDPENIFNPGKKIDTSWQYALDHIIKE
jgi:FAD/FMN-containing dehydrogenase